ncbi:hypothetical protein INS49_001769 [Diaporthe citri]|uniref:uncharacterized protein n=1 Tax=Diaporthe citri TaxID=83186 RepID=UPI001C80E63C|nr:uncharacterized protein INS49_001769 [Diaporthe citri]KAG6367576.1 hypothetical protein INS49_001769 [Diaporthe citri]
MPIPPQTVHSNGGKHVFVSTISSPNVHEYRNESEHVVIKQTTAEEVNILRRVGKNHPNIIRYIDSLGDEIVAGYKTCPKLLLVMEKADGGTLKDLVAHVRGLNTARRPTFVLPAQFLYNVLASLIEAVLYLETSLTVPMQHIDCHIGNVAFFRRRCSWPSVKILDFNRVQPGGKGYPSPAIGVFARGLLQHRCVLPSEFVDILEELSAPLTSLGILTSVQALVLARARKCTPPRSHQWLTEYFDSQ